MGLITAEIELSNPTRPALAPLVIQTLVDTGRGDESCIPSTWPCSCNSS